MDSNQIINAIHALNASFGLFVKEGKTQEANFVLDKIIQLINQL